MTVAAPERMKSPLKKAGPRPVPAAVTTTTEEPAPALEKVVSAVAREGAASLPPSPRRRLWTVAEFERLIDVGIFGSDERLELIEGEIIRKMTQKEPHATAIMLTLEALRAAFPVGHHVRVQAPLKFGANSRPEPDLAVVAGTIRDYAKNGPTTAVLVVEVSDSTLRDDRVMKAALYARADIQEYWIVNIPDRVLEVYREPAPMTDQPLGHGYGNITRRTVGETVAPLAAPGEFVAVADLLP